MLLEFEFSSFQNCDPNTCQKFTRHSVWAILFQQQKISQAVVSITGKMDRETVHGEVAESPKKVLGVCGERGRMGGVGRSVLAGLDLDGFESLPCILISHLSAIQHSLAFSHAEINPALYYIRRFDVRRKNRLENSIQFIHGMREGFSKWGCQKVFKELHTHTKKSFLLFKSKQHGK